MTTTPNEHRSLVRRAIHIGASWIGSGIHSAVIMATGASGALVIFKTVERLDSKSQHELALDICPTIADLVFKSLGKKRHHDCKDCGLYGHGFMLVDDVWTKVLTEEELAEYPVGSVMRIDKEPLLICLSCYEERLGRALTESDFSDYPINRPLLYAYASNERIHA